MLIFVVAIWFGVIFLDNVTENMFSLRPFTLTLIDSGRTLINYIFIGVILHSWKKKN